MAGNCQLGEKRGDTALTTRCHLGQLRGHFPKKSLCLGEKGERERRKRASACETGVGRIRSERQNSGSARDTLSQHGSARNSSSFLFKPVPLITATTTDRGGASRETADTNLLSKGSTRRVTVIPPSDTILSDEN